MTRPKPNSPSTLTEDVSIQATHIPAPVLELSNTSCPLEHLVRQESLPCIIQCDEGWCSQKHVTSIDLRQPLLAYMTRTVRKVSAHSLTWDRLSHQLTTVGNGLLIPEDYPGWFAVLGNLNTPINPHRVPHFRMLSLLSATRCSHFLVAGKHPIHGDLAEPDDSGVMKTKPYSIVPGTVLRRAGLYREETPPQADDKKKKKKKKGKQTTAAAATGREFMKCFDEQDRTLYISKHQKGVFYNLDMDGGGQASHVLQMKDILRYTLPLTVRLVHGPVPTTPHPFTQVLLLTDCGVSQTLVASTLLCYRNVNMEIPLGSSLRFRVARTTPELVNSKAYMKALEMCKKQTPSYVRDIKIVFGNSHLMADGVARVHPNTNPNEKPSNKVKSAPLGGKLPVTTTGCQTEPAFTAEVPGSPREPSSARSTLRDMSDSVLVSHETFIISEQPPTPTAGPVDSGDQNAPTAMANKQRYLPCQDYGSLNHTYDNNIQPWLDHSSSEHEAVDSGCSGSLPSTPGGGDSSLDSETYFPLWNAERRSTITIPSKVGRPVIPGKSSPVDDRHHVVDISVGATASTPPPKPHRRQAGPHSRLASPPSNPDQRSWSETSSVNDSDSFTSLSENSSLSEWATDEECSNTRLNINHLTRIENPVSDNHGDFRQQWRPSPQGWRPYIQPVVPPGSELANPASYSLRNSNSLADVPGNNNSYLDLFHEDEQKPPDESLSKHDEDGSRREGTYHGYSQPDNQTIRTATSENGYSQPDNQTIRTTTSENGYSRPDNQTIRTTTSENGYSRPDNQTFRTTTSENGYSQPDNHTIRTTSENGYSQPDNHTIRTTSENGYSQPDNQIYRRAYEELGYSTINSLPNGPSAYRQSRETPPLPPRSPPLPPAITCPAVLAATPGPTELAWTPAHKEMLVGEMRRAGVKPATEVAVAGIALADVVNLFSEDVDFDQELSALLPGVSLIDVKRVAAFLRTMKEKL